MEEQLKILLLEQNKTDCMMLQLCLKETNTSIKIDEIQDVNQGFSALVNNHYDCVLLNYHLPNADCLTFIHKIKDSAIKVPIIILIDAGKTAIAEECIKAGANEYLIKSTLSSETIVQILRRAIRLHDYEMEIDLLNQQLQFSQKQLILREQQLASQQQKIETLEESKLKSLFLATISHELRTPMNAIIGFAQILLRPKFSPLTNQQFEIVKKILNNGRNLLTKINTILEFSYLQAGELELNPQPLNLEELVNHTLLEISALAQAKNLSLMVSRNLNNTIVFNDAARLQQILTNLLTNAIKFTENGNIWVEISEIPKNRIKISVKDTGIGIADQDFENIFVGFHQVDQGMSRKYSGTGLGLAIIDSLVRIMGGKIYVESQLGVGSMFTIELPRKVNFKPDSDHLVCPHLCYNLYPCLS